MDWSKIIDNHFSSKKKLTVENFLNQIQQEVMKTTANTLFADVNEIWMAFSLADGDWTKIRNGDEAEQALLSRIEQIKKEFPDIGLEMIEDQKGRADIMSFEILQWAEQNGFGNGEIVELWWTARPGILSKAVGQEVDWKKNPTDVLIKFSNGEMLGVSAKSTKSAGDIGFKNPGLGALSDEVGIDLYQFVEEEVNKNLADLGIVGTKKQMKAFIRANPDIQEKTQDIGRNVLTSLRNMLYQVYVQMDEEELRNHIVNFWMDAGETFPYYVKVTGRGKKGNYSATVEDVINNDKIKSLMAKKPQLKLEVGPFADSIGVLAGDKKIMKMRFKYESEKLASGIKLSGDPW